MVKGYLGALCPRGRQFRATRTFSPIRSNKELKTAYSDLDKWHVCGHHESQRLDAKERIHAKLMSESSDKDTHREQIPAMCALLQLRHCPVVPTNPCTKLLKHPLLPPLPFASPTFLQHAVEVLLCLPPTFLNGRNQVLFVSMTQVAGDVGVLECLKRRECRLSIEVCDGTRKSGRVNTGLGKKEVPV